MAVSRINEAGLNVNQYGNRNLIINGAQNVHQRGDQSSLTANAYGTDRFEFIISGRDELVFSLAQDTDVPSGSGFSNSLKYTTTTAESAIAANEYAFISQKIEAQNLQQLAYGTSSAKKLTASFWVKSSVTGTFCLGMYKDDAAGSLESQVHNKTYTISSASTWEHKTITFEANTLSGGGITDDNGIGLYLTWHLAAGSDYDSGSSTSSGWATYATNNWCEPSTTDAVITTTNATFYLTGVQLEVGDTATDFEHRTFADELARCQRYYQVLDSQFSNGAYYRYCNAFMSDATAGQGTYHFPVEMRATPTLTASGTIAVYDGANVLNAGAVGIVTDGSSKQFASINPTSIASGGVQYRPCVILSSGNTTSKIEFKAEL